MRKTALSIFFVAAGFLGPRTVQAITCYAQSPVAWGIGYSYNYYAAQNIALYECQIRTPYGLYCVITGCSYYQTGPSYLSRGGMLQDNVLCPEINDPESPDFDPACPPTFEQN